MTSTSTDSVTSKRCQALWTHVLSSTGGTGTECQQCDSILLLSRMLLVHLGCDRGLSLAVLLLQQYMGREHIMVLL